MIKLIITLGVVLISTNGYSNPSHYKLKTNIEYLISEDSTKRIRGEKFFLTAPKQAKQRYISENKQALNDIVKELPLRIDKYTTLTSAIASKDGLFFHYKVDFNKGELDKNELSTLKVELFTQSVNQLCTLPRSALYMLYGKTITRFYSGNKGSSFFELNINWELCKKRS